ncbi:hypothetical protein AMK26_24450 [Streptomyces sp. CB03234]|uniref:hypothetical protein n=1 Tax=Streptomyces sp. (strain CB03234) TaxID=1703937 RepID=UPI00093C8F67|nr:hypothetical protein [Streptomyces sp. CB03234]OKK02738.1 hypothetical protein AMK26_24450 [Streptomyces sp. CB03234]
MTDNAVEKARKAHEAAAAKLAEAEAVEDARQAERDAERAQKERELAAQFLENRRALEEKLRGKYPTVEEKAEAFKTGTLPALVAEYLARRQAISALRAHAQHCAALLEISAHELPIEDIRWVDPQEELRRWHEDAMPLVLGSRAESLAAEALAAYEVA